MQFLKHGMIHRGGRLVWMVQAIVLSSGISVLGVEPPRPASPLTAEQTEFFEKKIRPVLVKHCYECHSQEAEKSGQLKGGLRVDTREGLSAGGESGAALEAGKPEDSLLLEALRYETFKMPPRGQLPAEVIADFAAWIKMGAPDPRVGATIQKRVGIDLEAGRRHWAYQPVRDWPVPEVQDVAWPATTIDRFVLAKLESRELKPVADASRETLIRRLTFDILGLPPTPEQIDDFVKDSRSDAYESLVERVLGAPQFGERWGRHWLDVVRYADSVTLRGFILPEAWRYRDYVIDSFNADRPFDQFVREQVAGDLLPATNLAERQRQAIATTFLTLGNTNLEEQDKVQLRMDVVDEQLDAITKGLLAQTVTCARCHDHKFDPIPTRDYYALAGILRNAQTLEHANVSKWLELPLPLDPESEERFQKQEAQVAALQDQIKAAEKQLTLLAAAAGEAKSHVPEVVAAQDLPGIVVDDAQAKQVGEWKLSQSVKPYIGAGYLHDIDSGKGAKTLTFQPEFPKPGIYEVRLAYTAGGNRTKAAAVTVFSADGEKTVSVNQQQAPSIDGRFVSLGQYRFEQNGQGFVIVSNEGTQGHVIADAVQFLSTDPAEVGTKRTPAPTIDPADPQLQQVQAERQLQTEKVSRLKKELQQLTSQGPQRPRFMSVREESKVEDCAIHIRGTVHNLGATVPRGFLSVVDVQSSTPLPTDQSGRRELGDWLASPQNPLPARVMANRVWHWLLGSGIVRTTDNFGTTGETPSHPELLDHLASRFVTDGWSVKSLVRQIVLSRTYRLSATGSPDLQRLDPENQLFGRAHRRRQDAECLLDAMLMASGRLDLQMGGTTIRPGISSDFGYEPRTNRRAVYWPVFRNALPELFEVFDFPDPSMVSGRRNVSTVAPQALFLMNSGFVREQSVQAARRLLAEQPADDSARINLAFRRLLGRFPTAPELAIAVKYVEPIAAAENTENHRVERWAQLVQAIVSSVDFRYLN